MTDVTAYLRYDFETNNWEAVAYWNDDITGSGDTPEDAINNLRFQCNKHDLWPTDKS